MEAMCNDQGVIYINNDPSFRLGDGVLNEGFYGPSGSLNQAGKNKLLRHIQLGNMVSRGGQFK